MGSVVFLGALGLLLALLERRVVSRHLREEARLGLLPAQLGQLEQDLGGLGPRLVLVQIGLDESDGRAPLLGDQRLLGAQERFHLLRHRQIAHRIAGVELGLLVVAASQGAAGNGGQQPGEGERSKRAPAHL